MSNIPEPSSRGVIFDFDGVIADTEWLHSVTFRAVLGEEGIHITDEDHDARFLGINDRTAFVKAFAEVGRTLSPPEVEQLVGRKSARYSSRLSEVKLFGGARELIESLSDHVPLAIASGGRGHEIRGILAAHGLLERFVAIFSSDEVPLSKPAPDLFLAAFRALGEQPGLRGGLQASEVSAIEDSIHGVRSAKAAGLWCIAVAHTYPRERLTEADRTFESLRQLDAAEVLRTRVVQR